MLKGDFLKIPDEELKKGVELCFNNATSLIEDAEILVKHGSYGHARFVVLSAIEEICKAFIYTLNRIEVWKSTELTYDVIHHKPKFTIFVLSLFADAVGKEIERGRIEIKKPLDIDDFIEMGKDLDSAIDDIWKSMREESLYVDYREGRWLSPSDVQRKDVELGIEIAKAKKAEFESQCRNTLSVPIDLAKAVSEFIDNQLFPWFLDQFYKNADELYKDKVISKRLYEAILSSRKKKKLHANEKP